VDATSFELNVLVPSHVRYAATLRDLAVHAARYAGCRGADADQYGAAVESVAAACLSRAGAGQVRVVLRRGDGPLEFLIACERPFEADGLSDAHITIGWTQDSGRPMCRIARHMPLDV
jgi:hypothetical protein